MASRNDPTPARSVRNATDFAKLDVQAAGDGGLTSLALSPSYVEDQLVFAYITTASDNRVVRFAKGQAPKPGDAVTVRSNGTSVTLRARLSRELRAGVVRIAEPHAGDLQPTVELSK